MKRGTAPVGFAAGSPSSMRAAPERGRWGIAAGAGGGHFRGSGFAGTTWRGRTGLMTGTGVERVTVVRDGTTVLRDVTLQAADGELLVVLGSSGSGKSTLLRALAGLDEITSGEVVIRGRRVTGLPAARAADAMVFQASALIPFLDVSRNLGWGLRVQGRPEAEVGERVTGLARQLRLDPAVAPPPRAAVRRRARPGRHRPRAGADPGRLPARRAARRPRRGAAGRGATADRRDRPVPRRPDRSTSRTTRPRGSRSPTASRAAPGRCRAGGHAQGAVRAAGGPVRRRVHRRAADRAAACPAGVQRRAGRVRGGHPDAAAVAGGPAPLVEHVGHEVVLGLRAEDVHGAEAGPTPESVTLDAVVSDVEYTGRHNVLALLVDAPPVVVPGGELSGVPSVATLHAYFPPRAAIRPGDAVRVAVEAARAHVFDAVTGRALHHPGQGASGERTDPHEPGPVDGAAGDRR